MGIDPKCHGPLARRCWCWARDVRVKLSSVAFLKAAGGYDIRLDDEGLLIEFLGDWRA